MLSDRDTVPAVGNGDGSEERTLRIAFDDFGWESAQILAGGRGVSLEEWVAVCCMAHAQRLEGDALSLRPPRFKVSQGEVRDLRISLPPATWRALEEATRGVELERLVEHATISHAALESESVVVHASQAHQAAQPAAAAAPRAPWSSTRRRLAAAAAVAVGAPLVPVGLAAAGLALPDPVDSAFEAVGIELPNQGPDAPPPQATDDAATTSDGSERPAANSGDSQGQRPAEKSGKNPRSRGRQGRPQGGSDGSGSAGGTPGATPVGPQAGAVTGTVPSAPSVPPQPDTPQPGRNTVENRVRDLLGDALDGLRQGSDG